jgi:hypothetical protein
VWGFPGKPITTYFQDLTLNKTNEDYHKSMNVTVRIFVKSAEQVFSVEVGEFL